jgi:hypothetical protein
MSYNFKKYLKNLKQEKFKDFQVLLYKFKDLELELVSHRSRVRFPPLTKLTFQLARCGFLLRVISQTSYSPEYITPTHKK